MMMMMESSSSYQLTGNGNTLSGSSNGQSSSADQLDATAINTNMNSSIFAIGSVPSPGSLESRGLNALHRRALQLKRWHEAEQQQQKVEESSGDSKWKNSNKRNFASGESQKQIQFSEPTLFLAACASGDYEEVGRLLNERRVDINVANVDGLTALHHACIDDNPQLVRYLLQAGANVNAVDNEGWSALHATASCGHLRVAELLLRFGADPGLVNVDGELALDLADDERMRNLLAEHMRQQGLTDLDQLRSCEHEQMRLDAMRMSQSGVYEEHVHERSGATILHVAACKGYLDVLEMLLGDRRLRRQIRLDVRDAEGWTPLAAAAYWSQPMIVELLLLHGADPNAVTNAGQTLDQLTEHDLILQLLKQRRQQISDEITRKQAQEKDNLVVASTPSTPVAESETQRKAHAKRARESRRSTQGISADDVNRAKDQLMLATSVSDEDLLSTNETTSFCKQSEESDSPNKSNNFFNQPTPLTTITELSSPPVFTATLARPPLLSAMGRQQTGLNESMTTMNGPVDQQLDATICLQSSNEDSVSELNQNALDADSIVYRRKNRTNRDLNSEAQAAVTALSSLSSINRNNSVDKESSVPSSAPPSELTTSSSSPAGGVFGFTQNRRSSLETTVQTPLSTELSMPSMCSVATSISSIPSESASSNSAVDSSESMDIQTVPSLVKNPFYSSKVDQSSKTFPTTNLLFNRTNRAFNEDQNGGYDQRSDFGRISSSGQTEPSYPSTASEFVYNTPKPCRSLIEATLEDSLETDSIVDRTNKDNEIALHCNSPEISSIITLQPPRFTVPVLIETPCTPEPNDQNSCTDSSSERSESTVASAVSEEATAADLTLSRRRKPKRRPSETLPTPEELGLFDQLTMAKQQQNSTIQNGHADSVDSQKLQNQNVELRNPNRIYKKQTSLETSNPMGKYQSPISSTTLRNRPRSFDSGVSNVDSQSGSKDSFVSSVQSNKTATKPETSSNQISERRSSTDLPENEPKDYKRLYEQLLIEFDAYKQEVLRKEQEMNREKRQMQRKLGELEEELKQMELVTADNQRLKEENGALIRVISKLSKGSN